MNQESRIAALAQGKFVEGVLRNADPSKLYEESILYDKGQITQSGGLASQNNAPSISWTTANTFTC